MTLFPSYNLEIKNYMDKYWFIDPCSKFESYITR